jgi:Protein of unknown function (DUF5672)
MSIRSMLLPSRMMKLVTEMLVSRYRPTLRPTKTVAVVVPISNRSKLTADEEISLRHLRHFLGGYDKFLIAPKGLKFQLPGFETRCFSRKFFGSMRAHSRLLYWPGFYKGFEEYKYILIHHLDALVFSDQLLEWCGAGVDYIGAPWIPCADASWVTEPRVGNGGLALMKVEAVLTVLHERYRTEPARYWEDRFAGFFKVLPSILLYLRMFVPSWLRASPGQKVRQRLQRIEVHARNNDLFWSYKAVKYVPSFRIPDWKTGLRFAFEVAPRLCFELNERKLPFGCHAWPRYDRAFWEPYLMK